MASRQDELSKGLLTNQPRGFDGATEMEEIDLGRSLLADICCVLCCPASILCSWFQVDPREEVLILNCGILTGSLDLMGLSFQSLASEELTDRAK